MLCVFIGLKVPFSIQSETVHVGEFGFDRERESVCVCMWVCVGERERELKTSEFG
jgi:hypothetical protein